MKWFADRIISYCLMICFAVCFQNVSQGDVEINPANGDQLDGHVVGSTANYTDTATGASATLTTRALHTNGFVDTFDSAGGILGLGPSDTNSFDPNEFWSFDWNRPTILKSISFGQVDAESTDQIFVQCDDWIGKTFNPGGGDRVEFTSSTGTFTLDRGAFSTDPNQTWTLDDLTNGVPLRIAAGSDVTFSVGSFSDANMRQLIFGVESDPITADSFAVSTGSVNTGGLPQIASSDDQYLVLDPRFTTARYQLIFTVDATSPMENPCLVEFTLESKILNFVGTVDQKTELFDYVAGQFVTVDNRLATSADSVVVAVPTGDASRFVEAGTRAMQARISYQNSLPFWVTRTANIYLPFRARVDHIMWTVTP